MNKKKKTFFGLNVNQIVAIFGLIIMLVSIIGQMFMYY